jgi:predicted RNA-binding protein
LSRSLRTVFSVDAYSSGMCRSTVYMSTKDGVLELVPNAVRLNKDGDLLVILDDVGDRLEFRNVRIKEINLLSNNIVLEKE